MELLRNNLEALLPSVKEAINEADFIAVDTELTGLGTDPKWRIAPQDDPQDRYSKMVASASTYVIVQFGVCCFKWDPERKSYISKPFNAYIFPRAGTRFFQLDRDFVSQASSLQFLSENDFDFNKWISQGISYVSREEEEKVLGRIDNDKGREDIVINAENREYVDNFINSIGDWLQNSHEKVLSVPSPTAYHRRLVHQEVKKRWNGNLGTDGKQSAVRISKLTDEEKNYQNVERGAMLKAELANLVGFRKVIDAISESKAIVIGHNMYLDACQTFRQFNRTLPSQVQDFKKEFHEFFPRILDTKYLATSIPRLAALMENTALETVMHRVQEYPFQAPYIEMHPDFGTYDPGQGAYHEAGFDAYATGVAFLRMAAYAEGVRNDEPLSLTSPTIQNAVNKIFLMKSDISHLDIVGDEVLPPRLETFRVYDFPDNVTAKEIKTEFADTAGSVTIQWIDSTSCFITLNDTTMLGDFEKSITEEGRAKNFPYQVESYQSFRARNAESEGGEGFEDETRHGGITTSTTTIVIARTNDLTAGFKETEGISST
ncbi:hypothetical protein HDV00_003850 [Rhizophlyctis rosea]|nr:hypothetical protein HDV00_003850 [Rhizophlyctis rosea]